MTADAEDRERRRVQGRLRLWISVLAVVCLFGSYLLDVVDDFVLNTHRFEGPPMWLVGLVAGILFGTLPPWLAGLFKGKE